jgi:hypothetical protein
MSYANKTFKEISRQVAEDFLHSVVVVDDQAYLHASESAGILMSPGRSRGRRADAPPIVEEAPAADDQLRRRRQDLNAKSLIDSFANVGLVCAVLRPQAGDGGKRSLEARTDKATQRADIVILDWRIRDDEEPGTTTLNLINTILESDDRDRLRLIAVYTGEPDLPKIADRIGEFLEERQAGQVTRSDFGFTAGAVRISLYAKSGGRGVGDVTSRTFSEDKLPQQLISEFSGATTGLLSNVALKSLGALRDNTHRLITKFSNELDAPYLAHRALMVPPEEAEQHPIPLLSSELQDVLEDREVSSLVSPDVIQAWLSSQMGAGLVFDGKFDGMTAEDVRSALVDLIEKGLDGETSSENHESWKILIDLLKDTTSRENLSRVTDLLTPEEVEGRERDMAFALLTAVRSRYDAPNPILTLGTIVVEESPDGPKYLCCIQPPCDSIRLPWKTRAFPFLRMVDAATSAAQDFDVVVRDGAELKALRLDLHPYQSRLINFKPRNKAQREIRAAREGNEWVFQRGPEESRLRWVADLKPAQAQRVANMYGATIARVGLTESEWLRRMAKPRA